MVLRHRSREKSTLIGIKLYREFSRILRMDLGSLSHGTDADSRCGILIAYDQFLLFHFPVRRRADLLKKTGVKKPLGYGMYSPSGMSNPWLTGYYPFASMYLVLLPSPILISAPLCTNRFSILAADAELVPVICSTSRRVIISFVERYARTVSSAV